MFCIAASGKVVPFCVAHNPCEQLIWSITFPGISSNVLYYRFREGRAILRGGQIAGEVRRGSAPTAYTSPHSRQQAVAHPPGILPVACQFLLQGAIFQVGADDQHHREKDGWQEGPG